MTRTSEDETPAPAAYHVVWKDGTWREASPGQMAEWANDPDFLLAIPSPSPDLLEAARFLIFVQDRLDEMGRMKREELNHITIADLLNSKDIAIKGVRAALASTPPPEAAPAAAIVQELAAWSRRYPRGGIYPMSMRGMDDELIAIEEKAKALIPASPARKEADHD